VAAPGKARPSASVTQAIVTAVPSMLQVPGPGQALHSMARNWSSVSSPRTRRPIASFTSLATRAPSGPSPTGAIPPGTRTVGRSHRAAAMSRPGTILSHEQIIHRRLAAVGLQRQLGRCGNHVAERQDVVHPRSLGDAVTGRGHAELDRHAAGGVDRVAHDLADAAGGRDPAVAEE